MPEHHLQSLRQYLRVTQELVDVYECNLGVNEANMTPQERARHYRALDRQGKVVEQIHGALYRAMGQILQGTN